MPLLREVRLDTEAVLWTLGIATIATLLFGLAPALRLSSTDLRSSLSDAARGSSAGMSRQRLRNVLVVAEVALACVLLAGAGLLLRSFLRVLDVDLGFQPAQASVIRVVYDEMEGRDLDKRGRSAQELLRKVKEVRGVEEAGIADMLPLGRNRSWGLAAKGHTYGKDESLSALVRIVTPGYFDAMGMRLVEGRDFSWRDDAKAERVVIINEAAARHRWQGENPVGRLARVGGSDARVIGVLADVREHSLEDRAEPEMYLPTAQSFPEGAELVIRSGLSAETLAPTVMQTLRRLNPNQPAAEMRPLQHIVDRAVSPRRFLVMLVAGFALLGLLLATLGIYGVISYSVAQQTQEIGIRMALGATAPQVQVDVVGRALKLAGVGILLGGIASIAAGRFIATQLYGISPSDPLTFAAIVVVLATAALIAGYVPARRASRIQPLWALRIG